MARVPRVLNEYPMVKFKQKRLLRDRGWYMRYRKIFRIPIAIMILILHGINPFRMLGDIVPMIRLHLTDWEKEYIINTCLYTSASEELRHMIYD